MSVKLSKSFSPLLLAAMVYALPTDGDEAQDIDATNTQNNGNEIEIPIDLSGGDIDNIFETNDDDLILGAEALVHSQIGGDDQAYENAENEINDIDEEDYDDEYAWTEEMVKYYLDGEYVEGEEGDLLYEVFNEETGEYEWLYPEEVEMYYDSAYYNTISSTGHIPSASDTGETYSNANNEYEILDWDSKT